MLKQKLFSVLLPICMLVTPLTTFAEADTPFRLGYSVGQSSFTIDGTNCTSNSAAAETVTIAPGGSADFGFYLPFDARSVTLTYENASGTVVVDSGSQRYSLSLSGSGSYQLIFGTHLGYEAQPYEYDGNNNTYAVREFTERSGERTFTIESEGGITVKSLTFEKEKTPVPYEQSTEEIRTYIAPNLSAEAEKTVSTVMIDLHAPILVVNGAKRYVDYNAPDTTPYVHNDTLYLPIQTVAEAFGYYYEDIPEKMYALMRSETHEFRLNGKNAQLSTQNGTPQTVYEPVILYIDGQTWAAVRYFAELGGDTVGFKDGLAVIDDAYTVSDVLGDTSLYTYATGIFSAYHTSAQSGNTYYVAQSAASGGNGSAAAPFKTLAEATAVAQAGDTVIIREGVYRETLTPLRSGTATAPITFRAAEGESVVISAADVLSDLTLYQDNIYRAPMNWDLGQGRNQLFINGTSMTEARYPNAPQWREEGLSDLWPTRGDFVVSTSNSSVVTSETLLNQSTDDYWKGAYYVGAFGYDYALATGVIQSSTNGSLTLEKTTDKWWWSPSANNSWNYGCIIGHMNALDVANEWVKQDDGYVYMILPEGADPNTTQVEAKARQLVINLAGKQYIHIEGIQTIGGSVSMHSSKMCMLNGLSMQYISHYTLSADQRDGYIDRPYNVKNTSGAPQRGEVGLYVSGSDNAIVNCRIDHSAGAGIYGTGLYTYIANNVLNDCGYMGSYVSGITFNTVGTEAVGKARGGHAVFNNTVYNCGRSCLNIGYVDGVEHMLAPYLPMEIAYNDFHDGMLTTLDTGLVYEYYVNLGLDREKTKIHHNYIYSTQTKDEENPFAFGIYHDGGSCGTETYCNVVFNTDEEASFSQYPIYQQSTLYAPAYHTVYNNRSYERGVGQDATLSAAYFPQGKAFYAGAKTDSDYLVNYEGSAQCTYDVGHAVLSDGVVLENGLARFTAAEQTICFNNVDFGSGTDRLNLTVYGDKNYSCDTIEIGIGQSYEEATKTTHTVQVNAATSDVADNISLDVGYTAGVQNVYITMKNLHSLAVGSLMTDEVSERGRTESAYAAKTLAASFSTYMAGKSNATPTAVAYSGGGYSESYVNNTWGGTVLTYKNMYFRTDADNFVLAAGSNGEYAGQSVSVYLDSQSGTPVATCTVKNTEWTDFSPVTVPLTQTVRSGYHTVYLVFGDRSKTSNVYYFGFTGIKE